MDYIIVGSVVVLMVASAAIGYSEGREAVQIKWEAEKLEQAEATKKVEAEYRAQERRWASSLQQIMDSLYAEKAGVQDEYQATIDDLNAGTIRLREHYRSCEERVSKASTAASRTNEGSRGGLPEADQRAFIRIGMECDKLSADMGALQKYVLSITPPPVS